jgi:outer membrane protein TolC
VIEATNQLRSLFAERAPAVPTRLILANEPEVDARAFDREQLQSRALELNPDYLIQEEKARQERVRLGYARNQRLYEVNLKGAYGLNGLALSPYQSLKFVERAGYPSWSFGMEVRIPILGGIKGRNEVAAADVRLTAAELNLRAIETEIDNGLDTALQKVAQARSSVLSYRSSVNYNQSLLHSALVQLDAGKLDSRHVLEIEADLLDARVSLDESLVQFELAELELSLIDGGLLQDNGLEITQAQLQARTAELAKARHWGDAAYRRAVARVQTLYPDDASARAHVP